MTFLPLGQESITLLLSVIHKSHSSQSLSISDDIVNLILLPINPFFERKNNDEGFDLPNSSKPTKVNWWSLFS